MPPRAIVTYARSFFSLSVIRSLGARGVEVIAGDEIETTPGALSKYTRWSFTVPNVVDDPDGVIDRLDELVREHQPEDGAPLVLMPMQHDTPVVAAHRDRFEGRAHLALADSATIARLHNKRRLVEVAREAGVGVPQTWLVRSTEELTTLEREIFLPVFVKRPDGSAGAGIEKVDDVADLRRVYEELCEGREEEARRPFVQALAEGTDYCFAAVYDRGRRVASMSYECLATYPRNKGPGAIRRTVDAPELEAAGRKLLDHVGWHGIIELDFRWRGGGHEPQLIEANPRFFGGTFLGTQAGVDFPWLVFRIAKGERVEAQPPAPGGVTVKTPVLDLLATLSELVSGDIAKSTFDAMLHHTKSTMNGDATTRDLLRTLMGDLKRGLNDRSERMDRVREVLAAHDEGVLEVIDRDDPTPILGMLYPLALFVRHGELSSEVLVGAGKK